MATESDFQSSTTERVDTKPREVVETLTHDMWPPARSNKESFIDLYAVIRDEREHALLGEIFELGRHNAENFYEALRMDEPRAIGRRLRAVVEAHKAMLAVIKNLDNYRHGSARQIIVHYGFDASISTENDGKGDRSPSDALIEELYLVGAQNISDFANICRKRARILDDTPMAELIGRQDGFQIGPDRRMWKIQFRKLAIYLSGHSARMITAIEKRRTKYVQIINVHYRGDVPASKVATIRNKLAKNKEAEPEFAIAKNVKKASIAAKLN